MFLENCIVHLLNRNVHVCAGAVSDRWEIKMPRKIDATKGFCVEIPCTFQIPDSFTKYLNKSVEVVWKKTDASLGSTVFSSKSEAYVLKGRVTGDLLSNNCTTVFQNFPAGSNDTYFFRIQGPGPLLYTFEQGVNINVHPGWNLSIKGIITEVSSLTYCCNSLLKTYSLLC